MFFLWGVLLFFGNWNKICSPHVAACSFVRASPGTGAFAWFCICHNDADVIAFLLVNVTPLNRAQLASVP